jgi:hypothetical protein
MQRNLDQDHCLGAWVEGKVPSGIRCASFAAASPLSAALSHMSERGGVTIATGTADKDKQGLSVFFIANGQFVSWGSSKSTPTSTFNTIKSE